MKTTSEPKRELMEPARGWQMDLNPPRAEGMPWTWSISYWGRTQRCGEAMDHGEAKKALKEAMGDLAMVIGAKRSERSQFKQFVAQQLPKRPYVVAWVLMNLAEEDEMDRQRELCVAGAKDEEVRLHAETGAKMRVPLPKHHLAKLPSELAAKLWDGFVMLGVVGKKADAYGKRVFGYWWQDHSCNEVMVEILHGDGTSTWEPLYKPTKKVRHG